MTIVETTLVYAGIPLLVVALLAVLVLAPGSGRPPRYRPGRGWSYPPVWYCPHPAAMRQHAAATLGGAPRAIGGTPTPLGLTEGTSGPTARGGASGSW